MTREAVATVAVFAAAVSIGALGYAVVWGLDPSEPVAVTAAPEPAPAPPPVKPKPAHRVPPVVLTPAQPGDDAAARAVPDAAGTPSGDGATSAAIGPGDEVSGLPPRREVVVLAPPVPAEDAAPLASVSQPARARTPGAGASAAVPLPAPDEISRLGPLALLPVPQTPGDDARPRRAPSARIADPATGGDRALRAAPLVTALIPEAGEPAVEMPAVLPDPEPTVTVGPPAEHGHATIDPGKSAAVPPGTEGSPAPAAVIPRSALLPVEVPQVLAPRRAVRPERAPKPQRIAPFAPAARTSPSDPLAPPGVVVTRGVPAVPIDPPGVMVVRGVPPVPETSPGLVRGGPLIITLPSAKRR